MINGYTLTKIGGHYLEWHMVKINSTEDRSILCDGIILKGICILHAHTHNTTLLSKSTAHQKLLLLLSFSYG